MKYGKLATVSLGALAFSIPAYAQNSAPVPNAPTATPATPTSANNEGSSTADIIVSARRREERLQDVPLTVSAVKADSLNKNQIRNFTDVAALVPGLSLTPAVDGIAPSATLRGVNYDINSSGSNGTVDFYLNDAPITAGTLFQSMFDVAQIEVLHGPQGTLRGLSSPSGSVTVTTTRPDLYTIGGYGDATVANATRKNLNGAINLPIIKGVLAVRVAGIVDENQANQVHSINDRFFEPYTRTYGERVTVRFDPIDTIDIQGSYQHLIVKGSYFNQVESAALATGGTVQGTLITAHDREAVESTPRDIHQGYDDFNLQGEWRFAGQKLNYVGSWDKTQVLSKYTGDTGAVFISQGSYPGNPYSNTVTNPNIYNYGQHTLSPNSTYSHEVRLSSDERLFGFADYVIGGLINHEVAPTSLLIQYPLFAAAPPSPATYYGIYQTGVDLTAKTIEKSVFGNLNVHIGQKTELSGGLRYIHFDNFSSLDFADPNGEAKFNATIYSASIKHRLTDNVMVYANTGSSWRIGAGTTGIIVSSSGQTGAITDPKLAALYGYTPETSKSYEIGFKTDWLNKKLIFNVDYYHQTFKNYILTSPLVYFAANRGTLDNPQYSPAYTQAGLAAGVPVKVDGVEGEVSYRASSHFNIDATFSYSKSKIENGQVPCTIYDANGNPTLPAPPAQLNFCSANYSAGLSAPFNASVQSEYAHPVGQFDGFIRGLLTFNGNSENQPTNPYDDIKAYAVVNAYVGLRDPNGAWELTGYVKNMFNTQRVLLRNQGPISDTYITFTGAGALNSNYRSIVMSAPQEFGVNLHIAFGSH